MRYHIPVMPDEVLRWLAPQTGGIYIDGTLGGGGHSEIILRTGAAVYGIDRDAEALRAAGRRLADFPNFHSVRGNFHDIKCLMKEAGVLSAQGVLLDLGVSSHQLDTATRGFSYHYDAPLDMRMDQTQAFTAETLVNTFSQQEIARILKEYGEENWAERIAEIIIEHRQAAPLRTTGDLVRAVDAAIPRKIRDRDKGHSAQKTFQGLRIAVNDELAPLAKALEDAVDLLAPGGRICVITFHSLEDRLVKQTFRRLENPCTCPPRMPVCVCGKRAIVRLPVRGAVKPGEAETTENPRARSAKLRVAERR